MKFSIITITHNRSNLIGETIKSVLFQTYSNFEYIIVDDGSTDNTDAVVKSFDDNRIKYVKVDKKPNINFVRNIGLFKATGDIVSFIDSDDLWHKEKLEALMTIFSKNMNINCVLHNIKIFGKNQKQGNDFYSFKNDFYRNITKDLLLNKILSYPIISIRLSFFKTLGLKFDETKKDSQYDFYLKICSSTKTYVIKESLAYIRKHDFNMSKEEDVTDCIDALNSYYDLQQLGKISSYLYHLANNRMLLNIADFYYRNNQYSKSNKYLKKITYHYPTMINYYVKSFIILIKNSLKYSSS